VISDKRLENIHGRNHNESGFNYFIFHHQCNRFGDGKIIAAGAHENRNKLYLTQKMVVCICVRNELVSGMTNKSKIVAR